MDKLKKYQNIIIEILSEQAEIKSSNMPDVENQVIADIVRNHFQLLSIGWDKSKFIYNCKFHFDIKNDKIWLQRNMTEVMIADELVKKGVDKNDIVLGFVPEATRIHTGFGVA